MKVNFNTPQTFFLGPKLKSHEQLRIYGTDVQLFIFPKVGDSLFDFIFRRVSGPVLHRGLCVSQNHKHETPGSHQQSINTVDHPAANNFTGDPDLKVKSLAH